MSDSEEEWWEKDIESFNIATKTKFDDEKVQNEENQNAILIDKEMLYNMRKNAEIEGHYGSAEKRNDGPSRPFKKKQEAIFETLTQKIPLSKLSAIAKMPTLNSFIELHNLKQEFLETIKSRKLSKNLLINACIALQHVCESPFEEHKRVIMQEIKEITFFWTQLSKYVNEEAVRVVGDEFHHSLLSIAKVMSKSTNIQKEVLKSLQLIGLTEMKRQGPNANFWNDFIQILEKKSINSGIEVANNDSILPTIVDLLGAPPTYIIPNIVKGAFPSSTEYRRLHMSLLKEDFLGSIRESLAIYNEHFKDTVHEGLVENIYVISRVQLGYGYSSTVREFVDLKYNENLDRKKSILRIDKRFLPGSLLIFTSNINTLDDMILATVLPYEETLKELGIIPITINNCNSSSKIFDGQLTLIEPTTYFEPYNRVYNVLANMDEENMPMKEYIINVTTATKAPAYLTQRLKHPTITHKGQTFNLTNPDSYPSGQTFGLDDAQIAAYKAGLSQEFCLIQGPPGTGKTHIGLEIILTLLKHTKERILIVCYTNHALDQTLNGLLKETDEIIRFGEQSKSEVMQKYTYKELGVSKDYLLDAPLKKLYWKTKQEQIQITDEFVRIQTQEDVVEQDAFEKVQSEVLSTTKKLFELNQIQTFLRVKDKRVFGMTTTFAARCHVLLQLLEIPIVIFEEAGEILESHIVTTLTPKCEQLILIGDHLQLKPNTSVFRLAKDYHLNVSLFERMINNNINYIQLKEQHRMRPCIAELVRDTIYPELIDTPNVKLYSDVKGMTQNLYFITHQCPENYEMNEVFNETSKTNKFEANFMIDLCEYLIRNGNDPKNITILTMYQGQRKLMHETRLQRNSLMKSVKITVVDNYQGEENDIILLSLVRSNSQGNIGFVGTKNRVCVALSRAKIGLYIIGNLSMLREYSSIWKKIYEKLEKQNAIGEDITKVMHSKVEDT